MLPSDLIPFIKQGDDAVDKYFIKKLRWATFRLRWQSIKRFPHRKKMIDCAFKAHWQGNYLASIALAAGEKIIICCIIFFRRFLLRFPVLCVRNEIHTDKKLYSNASFRQ